MAKRTPNEERLIAALREIEGYAPACSRSAVALSEASEDAGPAAGWIGVVRSLQRTARVTLRELREEV